jgi:hypothetical protein
LLYLKKSAPISCVRENRRSRKQREPLALGSINSLASVKPGRGPACFALFQDIRWSKLLMQYMKKNYEMKDDPWPSTVS